MKIHKCPKCECQIEKEDGCPNMNCLICGFSWCWVCGINTEKRVHLIFEVPCSFINKQSQFKVKRWLIILILNLLCVFLPLWLPFMIFYVVYIIVSESCCLFYFTHRPSDYFSMPLLFQIAFKIRLYLIGIPLSFVFTVVFSTIMFSVVVVPAHLVCMVYSTLVNIRWCLVSRRAKPTKRQKLLVKMFRSNSLRRVQSKQIVEAKQNRKQLLRQI